MIGQGPARGIHVVSVTPFLPDESLDEESLRGLVDFCIEAGAAGILLLGVMGEAERLSDMERERVIDMMLEHNQGRLEITVGVTAGSTVVARDRARAAARRGANFVMVAPPIGSASGVALRDHFLRVADGAEIPIVVQDHPASSGVKLPVEFLANVLELLPRRSAVKLEDPPTPPKIARLRELSPIAPIFGGLGGIALRGELAAGASGAMTGFAFPERLAQIVAAERQGEVDRAQRLFAAALPLIVFESKPGTGAGLRKEILRRRGVIAHATVRQPAPPLDPTMLAELDGLLASAGVAGLLIG